MRKVYACYVLPTPTMASIQYLKRSRSNWTTLSSTSRRTGPGSNNNCRPERRTRKPPTRSNESLQERLDSLDSALRQPYFGRLDYFETDGPPVVMGASGDGEDEDATPRLRTVYLGISGIPEKGISSWTAPVAKLWYTTSRQDGYTAPAGPISTLVDLKRYLRIRGPETGGHQRHLPPPALLPVAGT